MDTDEMKDKLKEKLSWENISESLPVILVVGVALLLLDKLLSIGAKMEPFFKKRKRFRKNRMFEIIDTIGDNIQLIDSVVKLLGIDLDDIQLKKIGDFMQNIGTGGKHLANLYGLLGLKGSKGGGSFKELQ